MENGNEAIKTEIKYKITSCYFCSEFLDNDNFKSHIAQCGQVLQKCPGGCLAYLQRKHIEQHLRECPRKIDNDDGRLTSYDSLLELEQNVNTLRSALHEEIRQRHRLIADIGEIRKQNQHFDSWTEQIEAIHRKLTKSLQDEKNNRTLEIENVRISIDQLSYQYKEVKEWRKELRILLDRFYRDLEFRNDVTANFEALFSEKDISFAKMKSLANEIEHLKLMKNQTPESEQNSPQSQYSSLNQCKRCVTLERKLTESLVEVRQMKNIVCETEDKYEKLENISFDVRKICAETKQELTDLDEHLRMEKKIRSFVNCEGHLIWRIADYSAKLKNGKENDIILKSPIFCNEPYGYSLRLDVLLDGFGTWKGRNLLACLTVIPGEWDTLLSWPCKLKADIILRDQQNDVTMAKDISKTVVVKKRDTSYEHNQYIYISHKAIKSQNYLKNDSIFFEVIVHST